LLDIHNQTTRRGRVGRGRRQESAPFLSLVVVVAGAATAITTATATATAAAAAAVLRGGPVLRLLPLGSVHGHDGGLKEGGKEGGRGDEGGTHECTGSNCSPVHAYGAAASNRRIYRPQNLGEDADWFDLLWLASTPSTPLATVHTHPKRNTCGPPQENHAAPAQSPSWSALTCVVMNSFTWL